MKLTAIAGSVGSTVTAATVMKLQISQALVSSCVRLVDDDYIREDFVGFVPVIQRDALSKKTVIVSEYIKYSIEMDKLLSQGCPVMASFRTVFKQGLGENTQKQPLSIARLTDLTLLSITLITFFGYA